MNAVPGAPALYVAPATAQAGAVSLALIRLGLLYLLAAAMFWPTVESMIAVWWKTPTFAHGFLVFPAACLLFWRLRRRWMAAPVRPEPAALLPLMAAGFLWLAGDAGGVQIMQHAGFVGILQSLFLGVLGWPVFRRCWFPPLFLAFMVPLGEQLVPLLQDVTATFAVVLLGFAGVPVLREGVLLQTPTGLFEVAEACAGVRFLIANIVVASVFAHLNYRAAYKAAAFMALAVILPVVANGFRGFGIILIAHWTDNEYAAGVDHLVYGWGFFAAVMLLSLYLGGLFADRMPAQGRPSAGKAIGLCATGDRVAVRGDGPRGVAFPILAAIVVAAPALYASYPAADPSWQAPSHMAAPRAGDGWRAVADPRADWQPAFRNATAEVMQTYGRGPDYVLFYAAFYARQTQGAEVVHQANRYADGEIWTRLGSSRQALVVGGAPVTATVERFASQDGRYLTVARWYWVDGVFAAGQFEAKARQILAAIAGRSRAAAAVALAVETDKRNTTAAMPESVLADYAASLPDLGRYLQGVAAAAEPVSSSVPADPANEGGR